MDIYLAKTQGFCAGVTYATDIVNRTIERFGLPVYVLHDIVHNTFVVESFRKSGVIFVEDLQEVPEQSRIIFSAHGVPPRIIAQAQERHLKIIDATCPLVKKVHREAIKYSRQGIPVILIGHRGHQEIIGTSGYVQKDQLHIISPDEDVSQLNIPADQPVAYLTQTTLSVDESQRVIAQLKQRFPRLISPPSDDICYATQNRQNAVKELAALCDLVIICGSPNSSNSNRLKETAENAGIKSLIIDSAAELPLKECEKYQRIGISSGASVPRAIVEQTIGRITAAFPEAKIHTFPDPEKKTSFPLPRYLL